MHMFNWNSQDERKEKGAEAPFEEINSQTFSKYDASHHL